MDTQPVYREDGNQTLQSCTLMLRALENVLKMHVPGQVVEIGCNKGVTSAMFADLISRIDNRRCLHVYDSFDGMPDPGERDGGVSIARKDLKASPDDVLANIHNGEFVCRLEIHAGWIQDTIPRDLPDDIAFALIDVDFYDATLHALRHVFPRLAEGGICVVDDVDADVDPQKQIFPGALAAIRQFQHEFPEVVVTKFGDRQVAVTRTGMESDTLNATLNLIVVRKPKDKRPTSQAEIDKDSKDEKRQFSVCFATFPYGGNGGAPSTYPEAEKWIRKTVHKAKTDPRIKEVFEFDKADTPITMTRNAAVWACRKQKIDFLVMVDSDMWPDYELNHHNDRSQKPFWDTAFDFLCTHYEKGPACVAAPYCGPPPNECVYVFQWCNTQSDDPGCGFSLEMYGREHAAQMSGIQPAAALPTGLIMFDVRLFDLTAPGQQDFSLRLQEHLIPYEGRPLDMRLIREIAGRCEHEKFKDAHSWFYYEYTVDPDDGKCYETQKASTEDVTATRDISLAGIASYGYNPVYCAWSSWAGHVKPKVVGKPRPVTADVISEKFVRAIQAGRPSDRVIVDASELIRASKGEAA